LVFLVGFWVLADAQHTEDSSSLSTHKFTSQDLTDAQDAGDSSSEGQSAHMKNGEIGATKGLVGLEQKISVTMSIPQIQFTSCEAHISFQSHQRNTLARVVSTIEHKPCTTSTGEYELLITIQDGNGVHQTLEFSETWEQKNDSPVESSKDYPIGENVTLKRIMAQGLRCECSDS
jgi:hypothetical protein